MPMRVTLSLSMGVCVCVSVCKEPSAWPNDFEPEHVMWNTTCGLDVYEAPFGYIIAQKVFFRSEAAVNRRVVST